MSETLTSLDLKNLQEVPDTLEMGELRKITTLQDISLAENEYNFQQGNDENERKIKTNSLKRFFRLPSKKKLEDGSFETEKTELGIEEVVDRKNLSGSHSKVSLKSSFSNYWGSVFKPKKCVKSTKSIQEKDSNLYQPSSKNAENVLLQATLKDNDNPKEPDVLEEIQSLNISEECP